MSRPVVRVNTAIYLHGTSGSSTATRALVEALESDAGLQTETVSPAARGGANGVVAALRDARWDLWDASRSDEPPDLLVSPCNIGHRGPARKHLLVVYDVMVFDRPDLFDPKFAAYFRLLVPFSVKRADCVVTMSEHAAERLRAMAPSTDVRVLRWPHDGSVVEQASSPVSPSPFTVVMVGATEPVKNQAAGVEGVGVLRTTTGADIHLRVIGPVGRAEEQVRSAMARVDPDGTWTSREVDVPGEVLSSAYAEAWVLLQPSLDEGYGLPLVEAARHGLPVVHSGRGAMPGVAPTVDAGGITADALASAMEPLLGQDRWEDESARGSRRAAELTPERFRADLLGLVHDLVGTP